MRLLPRKPLQIFSLSFMDCICCGFGAVILLFVLNRDVRKGIVETVSEEQQRDVNELNEQRAEAFIKTMKLGLEKGMLEEKLNFLKLDIEEAEDKLAKLDQRQAEVAAETPTTEEARAEVLALDKELFEAKQQLEKKRQTPTPWNADSVGGIQADSEYVIFVIDTSGSMTRSEFGVIKSIRDTLREVLSIYPEAKGFQILTSDGSYMGDIRDAQSRRPSAGNMLAALFSGGNFSSNPRPSQSRLRGRWYPADLQGRQRLFDDFLSFLRSGVDCNSSPEMGLQEVFRSYGSTQEEIAVYIFGDDSTPNYEDTLGLVRRNNREGRFRFHSIGFPSILYEDPNRNSGLTGSFFFADAMRHITRENGGAFVAKTREK